MRYLYLFFVFMFTAFALVQLNDDDNVLLWFAVYMYGAVLSGMAFMGKFNRYMIGAAMVVYLAGAIYLFPPSISDWIEAEQQAKSLQMKLPFIEEARESLGLLISFAIVTFYMVKALALDSKPEREKEKALHS
jgi:TRAP-type uncharacterized transport system fused permease subunit